MTITAPCDPVVLSNGRLEDECLCHLVCHMTIANDDSFQAAARRLNAIEVVDPLPARFAGKTITASLDTLLAVNAVNACYWAVADATPWSWRGERGFLGMLDLALELPDGPEPVAMRLAAALRQYGHGLQLLPERIRALEELAAALPTKDAALELKRDCGDDAAAFVRELVAHCPSFSDIIPLPKSKSQFVYELDSPSPQRDGGLVTVETIEPVLMHKRAWLTTMLCNRLASAGHTDLAFRDPERVAMAIDYRLPVACRHLGLLRLNDDLASRIDRREILPANGKEEISLRIATAVCFRRLLNFFMADVTPERLDLMLWTHSRKATEIEAHRSVTMAY